jgi:hypothetical protein
MKDGIGWIEVPLVLYRYPLSLAATVIEVASASTLLANYSICDPWPL